MTTRMSIGPVLSVPERHGRTALSAADLARLRGRLVLENRACERTMSEAGRVLDELRESSSLDDPASQRPLMAALRRLAAAEQAAAEATAALTRMATGGYGHCVRCLRVIGLERLEVRPATRYCAACSG